VKIKASRRRIKGKDPVISHTFATDPRRGSVIERELCAGRRRSTLRADRQPVRHRDRPADRRGAHL